MFSNKTIWSTLLHTMHIYFIMLNKISLLEMQHEVFVLYLKFLSNVCLSLNSESFDIKILFFSMNIPYIVSVHPNAYPLATTRNYYFHA